MVRGTPVKVSIPITTEVIERNCVAVVGSEYDAEHKTAFIDMDVRLLNWCKKLGLANGTQIHWENERTTVIQELSSFPMKIQYRVIFGDGWYRDTKTGTRVYFGVDEHIDGIDLKRGVTTTAIRAAVLLAVMAGIGLRSVAWLLGVLFHLDTSKSALCRWIEETADQLPDARQIVERLNADKPVSEGHLDEIYPRAWKKGCVLVLRDEHGRILTAQKIEERALQHVVPFLRKLKEWGLAIKTFYVDGCTVYRDAIRLVYPEATIQYDYFHVVQNIWKKLWRAMVGYRREIKHRSKQVDTPWYSRKLDALAKKLWQHRGLIFKNPDNISPEEQQQLISLMEEDRFVETVRGFLLRVWGIFRDSKGELGARQRLGHLKYHDEVQRNPDSPFAKAVEFLEERFEDMIAFLRHPGVKRNSLAESGIRILRRLEQGHDGFRTDEGRDAYLRLYQVIKYCSWQVYRFDGRLGLQHAEPPVDGQAKGQDKHPNRGINLQPVEIIAA